MGEIKLEPLLLTEDIEKIFNISRDFVETARKELGMPHYKFSKRLYRCRASEVEKWLKERKVNG